MGEIGSILGPVYLLIATGWLFGKWGNSGADRRITAATLNSFVYYLAMPAFLFMVTSRSQIPIRLPYVTTYGCAMIVTAIVAAAGEFWLYGRRKQELILAVMLAVHSNSAYVGLPVMQLAYGDVAAVVNISLFQVAFVTPLILLSLEGLSSDISRGAGRPALRRCLCVGWIRIVRLAIGNPIIIATVAGFTVGASKITIPLVLGRYGEILGQSALPTALIVLGLSLTRSTNTLARPQEVAFVTLCSLLVLPGSAYTLGTWVFHLEPNQVRDVTLMAAMPASLNSLVFARQFNAFIPQTAIIVTTTLLGSGASLAVLLFFLR